MLLMLLWGTPLGARAEGGTIPLDRLSGESWFGLYLDGKRVGHAHHKAGVRRLGGMRVFEVRRLVKGRLVYQGRPFIFGRRVVSQFEIQPPHRLIKKRHEDLSAINRRTITERPVGAKREVLIADRAGMRRKTVSAPGERLADELRLRIACLRGPTAGWSATFRLWDTMEQRQVTRTVEIEQAFSLLGWLGVSRPTKLRLRERQAGAAGIQARGIFARGSCDLQRLYLGGGEELRREDAATAPDPARIQEYVLKTYLRTDQPLGHDDPSAIQRAVFVLPGVRPGHLMARPWLEAQGLPGGTRVTLDSRRIPGPPGAPDELPKAARSALREEPHIQCRQPELQAAARKITAAGGSPLAKARLINAWVHRRMVYKRVFVNDALAVLRQMEGDCSEYSLLTVALARAAGIPAYGVSGIAHAGDLDGRFGAHSWVRLYLDGAWVDMDPTWGQTTINATHIPMVDSGHLELQRGIIKVLEVGDGPGISDQEAVRRLLARVQEAVAKGDLGGLRDALQTGALVRRAVACLELPVDLQREVLAELVQLHLLLVQRGRDWASSLVSRVAGGGSFKLLRTRRGREGRWALFRLLQRDGSFSYLELLLARLPPGPVKIREIRDLASGKQASRVYRPIALRARHERRKELLGKMLAPDASDLQRLKRRRRLERLLQKGQHAPALALIRAMPRGQREEQPVLALWLQAARGHGVAEYRAAHRAARRAHPGTIFAAIHGARYHGQGGDLRSRAKALSALRRLVGPDPYLSVLTARDLLTRGRLGAALARAERAMRQEPELVAAHECRFMALVRLRRWGRAVAALEKIRWRFGTGVLRSDFPGLADFLKTPAYREWTKRAGGL